ncbi:MAG: CMD domain protein [Pantoea sp.]|uniref:CMD domain protein n=1 Tax=Pantoea sp. TaxID=69393 RepID=UPI00239C7D9C|nr:CMD domain protein [Pantoea sp.]MDE1187108.1 CMD domain protein [Pantoea sp.]
MASTTPDIIDLLVGVAPGSPIDLIRAERPETKLNAQKSYLALFEPAHIGDIDLQERHAIAAFVTLLHACERAADFYRERLSSNGASPSFLAAIRAESERGLTRGPYGKFPPGPLSVENTEGPIFETSAFSSSVLGPKLAAALNHTHLLVFRPRDASAAALQKLLDAGWSNGAIVTLSQIVAFLSFQIRVVIGLTALAQSAGLEKGVTAQKEIVA